MLYAAGYSDAELGAVTGATYTAVNRRLSGGRQSLRHLAARVRMSDGLTMDRSRVVDGAQRTG